MYLLFCFVTDGDLLTAVLCTFTTVVIIYWLQHIPSCVLHFLCARMRFWDFYFPSINFLLYNASAPSLLYCICTLYILYHLLSVQISLSSSSLLCILRFCITSTGTFLLCCFAWFCWKEKHTLPRLCSITCCICSLPHLCFLCLCYICPRWCLCL